MIHRTAFAAALALLPACDSHDDHEPHGSLEEEACEHLQEGPTVQATAAADTTGTLPDVNQAHHRVEVTLAPLAGGQNGGFVSLESAGGHTHLFLGRDVPVKVTDAAGAEVAFTATETGSELCTDIALTHELHLGVGRYVLELGPTAETSLFLLVETE